KALGSTSIAANLVLAYSSTSDFWQDAVLGNEDTYIQRSVNGLITATFGALNLEQHWSRDLLPTPRNYEEQLFPDYFGSFKKLPIVVAEIKSPTAAYDMVELDNRRVPCMMKLSLDQLLAANVKNPVVVGLLINEGRCRLMSLQLVHEALYIPVELGRFDVPQSKYQLSLLLPGIAPLMVAKDLVSQTINAIKSRPPSFKVPQTTSPLVRPSYHVQGIKIPAPLPPAVGL
ncbi:hypothetical protein EC957_010992, partial [Mortierella hygrophila]